MMKILLTGFEPFGDRKINTSWDWIAEFPARFEGHDLKTLRLPVEYQKVWDVLGPVVESWAPDVILSFGESRQEVFDLERVAVNLRDTHRGDNAGRVVEGEPILAGAPTAYFTGLPVKAMLAALTEAGIPARLSMSAGSYLCNECFYWNMHAAAKHPNRRAGFIHVPFQQEGVDLTKLFKSHPVEVMLRAIFKKI